MIAVMKKAVEKMRCWFNMKCQQMQLHLVMLLMLLFAPPSIFEHRHDSSLHEQSARHVASRNKTCVVGLVTCRHCSLRVSHEHRRAIAVKLFLTRHVYLSKRESGKTTTPSFHPRARANACHHGAEINIFVIQPW
jgi:hypothetical protein